MLKICGDKLFINGEETLLMSGAMHYFRTLPNQWRDRLEKIASAGFNCVETYVPWNLHEPRENEFNFNGILDVENFLKIAEEVGLYVIFRPSPYICAEWEFGGLPSWLLKYDGIVLRTMHETYIEKVNRYYNELIFRIIPYLSTNGGPIIAMQIENEYGSYGNDHNYLNYLKDALTDRGVDVPLFTSDGPTHSMLSGGTLPDIWKTINYGSKTEEAFEILGNYQSDMPKMVMEFWIGWFDHWGYEHITRESKSMLEEFQKMLEGKISVNFYMFHGGSNFGFMSGANYDGKHRATVTSYDYDSMLTESGDLTEKYDLVKKMLNDYSEKVSIKKHKNHKIFDVENSRKKSYGEVKFTEKTLLFNNLEVLGSKFHSPYIKPMEYFDQDYGFIVYETKIKGQVDGMKLSLQDVRDRAMIYLNDEYIGVIDRNNSQEIKISTLEKESTLKILVENMGRINYGPLLKDYKGITEGVRLNNQFLFNWNIYTLPLDNLASLKFENLGEISENIPTFYKGSFIVDELADTFIDFDGWDKGVIYINGFNLGRFWKVGPQKRLYLPKDLLTIGINEITVLELHNFGEKMVLMDKAKLS
ncbi:beta-galactosidase family protein [uncultured Cetobacterium sp.]|uniref:glycoside hydrolase family 35 protein n=1 Tax=uncultured Cetobacterium sp. TaxID=527638 RepID=UPI0026341E73|nr:beta-galactosidase family protein [uncultured Cetobacterium sp.]